jgi:HK97 family phage prohead protease
MAAMPEAVKRRLRMQVRATPEKGPGTGQAVVSTYDLEYDIGWGWTEKILPGCFADSIAAHPTIPIFYNHDWYGAPIGTGQPTETDDNQLLVDFRLYLNMGDLVDRVYQAMVDKALEEWSIGFWAEEITWEKDNERCDQIAEGDLAEASVCVRGANPETGTLELAARAGWLMGDEKEREAEVSRLRSRFNVRDLSRTRGAIPVHHTGTSTSTWDGPAQETKLDNEDGAAVYKKAFAWVDPEKDADTKAAYKFIHHFVAEDGTVGDASTVACSSGIAVLNGGRGGTTIPEGDIQGVYDHLAAHMKDADLEPPALKSDSRPRSAGDDDEPDAGELAQAVDALIDQVVLLLEADPPDTKGALDLLVSADSTVDDLLEVLGVPDDDDIAESERMKAAAEALQALAGSGMTASAALALIRSALERSTDGTVACANDGCGHMASVHEDTDDGDNMGACSTPDCDCPGFEDPDGTPTGGGDPADDESSKAAAKRATAPWLRDLRRKEQT